MFVFRFRSKFLRWIYSRQKTIIDFCAFKFYKLLKYFNCEEIFHPGLTYFSERYLAYRSGYSNERLLPKNLRGKSKLREDFLRYGIYPRIVEPKILSRGLSQHNEHLILRNIFENLNLNPKKKISIEIGSGHQGGNSGALTFFDGFKSLWIDGDALYCDIARKSFSNCNLLVLNNWVTRENILELISSSNFDCPAYIGIDIDGNDFWILREVLKLKPMVFCIEYNPLFRDEISVTIKYDPLFNRKNKDELGNWEVPKGIYGVSISALLNFANSQNYRLIAASQPGFNIFFIRSDLLQTWPTLSVAEVFRFPQKQNLRRILQLQDSKGFGNWITQYEKWIEYL